MPTKEIKELRQAGKLEEAYAMAKAELEADLSNIWGKRNLSWVLYAQLDELASNLDAFIEKINEVKELDLPASEDMFFDNISIPISKAARKISKEIPIDINNINRLFDSVKVLPLKRNSRWFIVLFSAFHKGMKESNRYIEFADWWDFKNFEPEDFRKAKLPDGKEIMAIAEQAFIAYAKHLLPRKTPNGETIFNKAKAEIFLPILSKIVDNYPQLQYPGYYYAKLLLAFGNKDNAIGAIVPFAKKKQFDFWVWDILSEAFSNDREKVLGCYCKALSCPSPEEMLVNLRQRMAQLLLEDKKFNEAKTEIELLVFARNSCGFNIPSIVIEWQKSEWYINAISNKSNSGFYNKHLYIAEELLFHDIPEELILITNVNSDKKIANFLVSETKFGYFKYNRFNIHLKVGDILQVKFNGGQQEGMHFLYQAKKVNDTYFDSRFLKDISGQIRIAEGKLFGFIDDAFIPPYIVSKYKLINGIQFSGKAIKTYNQEKKKWDWKLI